MKRSIAGLGAFLLAASAAAFAAEQKIAGEILKVDGASIQVKTSSGELLDVRLPDNVRFSGRAPSDWSKVTQGAFIGTAAVPQADGTLLAREVHVFPESMRGTGEGHRPMDNEPGSTMTNATVSSVGKPSAQKSTITNATVTQISGAQWTRSMTLSYKGGEKTVIVPDNVPVVMVEPVDRSNLVPGAHVVIHAAPQGDGKLTAQRVTIGVRGAVPPA